MALLYKMYAKNLAWLAVDAQIDKRRRLEQKGIERLKLLECCHRRRVSRHHVHVEDGWYRSCGRYIVR